MGLINNLPAIDANNSYRENIENVYFKIEGVFVNTEQEKVRISVRGWLSEYARHNQGIGVFKRVFYAPIEYFENTKCSKDLIVKRAYKYIKELPEFKDSKNSLRKYSGPIDITEEIVEKQEEELGVLIKGLRK